jgi:hypothetical protein
MDDAVLERLCAMADSLYERGYAHGSTGNLSVRVGDAIWLTPTGQPLKGLTPARLACIDLTSTSRNDNRTSKEFPFHLAIYDTRADAQAVVHLHSTYATSIGGAVQARRASQSRNCRAPIHGTRDGRALAANAYDYAQGRLRVPAASFNGRTGEHELRITFAP